MKICFFNLTEPQGGCVGNGVARVAVTLASALRVRGSSVDFYATPCAVDLKREGLSARAHFEAFLKEKQIDIAVWQMGNCSIPFSLDSLPCRLIAVWHNAPDYKMETYAERLLGKYKIQSGVLKKIILSRGGRFLIQTVYEIYRSFVFFYTCYCCDKFILLSEKFIPQFSPSKIFSKKVCAIANPASYDVCEKEIMDKGCEVLFVGRLEFGQKRPDLLLKIWTKVETRFPEWRLRIVGTGPDEEKIKSLAETLGLTRVSFEGFCDPKPFYRTAKIFCLTSAFEGFAMVLLEAAAFSCVPVVFNSYASVTDIITDKENGVLVPAFDCDRYAEELARLMSDDVLRARLAHSAKEQVANFSASKIAEKWERLFLEVMSKE